MRIRDISEAEIRKFADIVVGIERLRNDDDVKNIVVDIANLLGADFALSYNWSSKLQKYGNGISWNIDADHIRRYENWFQHCDPVSDRLRDMRLAVVDQVLPYNKFVKTEFFNDFLKKDGLHFGVNLFVFDGRRELRDFRIWRTKSRKRFGERELGILGSLEPFMRRALTRVGDSAGLFTQREAEVASLVARGFKDRDIAKSLKISFTTVRTHIANSLAKHGLSNRAELAALIGRTSR